MSHRAALHAPLPVSIVEESFMDAVPPSSQTDVSSPSAEHALSFSNVSRRYGDSYALSDASLSVRGGEFVTILGPSGSGKTTLLMMAAGFTSPSSGQIASFGEDITDVAPDKRGFGVVFQSYALFPNMTVAGNVSFPLRVRNTPVSQRDKLVRDALSLVDLSKLADRRPNQLSGGQQQRVAIARALVYQPKVLLLDEPLTALDRSLRDKMRAELKSLHQMTQATFMMVTHDQEEALSLSDTLVVINEGRIEQVGPPKDLYTRPATQFVAGFLGTAGLVPVDIVAASASSATVRLPDESILTAPCRDGCKDGQDGRLMLRPENTMLDLCHTAPGPAHAEETLHRVTCRVTQISYGGHTYHISMDYHGTALAAEVQNTQNISIGDTVQISFNPDTTWIIP